MFPGADLLGLLDRGSRAAVSLVAFGMLAANARFATRARRLLEQTGGHGRLTWRNGRPRGAESRSRSRRLLAMAARTTSGCWRMNWMSSIARTAALAPPRDLVAGVEGGARENALRTSSEGPGSEARSGTPAVRTLGAHLSASRIPRSRTSRHFQETSPRQAPDLDANMLLDADSQFFRWPQGGGESVRSRRWRGSFARLPALGS